MSAPTKEPMQAPRLVADRRDFLWVYLSSLGTLVAIFLATAVVHRSLWPPAELAFALAAAAVISLVPPLFARFLRMGRRATQVIFGIVLVPLVAALVVNAPPVVRSIRWWLAAA